LRKFAALLRQRIALRLFRRLPFLGCGARGACAALQPLLVIIEIAVEHVKLAVRHQPKRVRHGLDEVAIVRHDQQAAREVLQGHAQGVPHVDVEVIRGFVQQQ
jgi:hypothetical protein